MPAETTPMKMQYNAIKAEHPDCLLFYRLGDFYEMFDDDAVLGARELNLALTTRDRGKPEDERTPMCGVPYHSAEQYISKLIAKGYKVAVCEQMEDPKLCKGLVSRDIVRIISPGTIIETSMLREGESNYLGAVMLRGKAGGCAFADVSTGEVCAASFETDAAMHIQNEISRFRPRECVLAPEAMLSRDIRDTLEKRLGSRVEPAAGRFDPENARKAIANQYGENAPELDEMTTLALGALLAYLTDAARGDMSQLRVPDIFTRGRYMELDAAARRNLELTENLRTGEKRGSLLWVLDKTKTPMGGRMLRSWVERPLLSPVAIRRRLAAVEELFRDNVGRAELAESSRPSAISSGSRPAPCTARRTAATCSRSEITSPPRRRSSRSSASTRAGCSAPSPRRSRWKTSARFCAAPSATSRRSPCARAASSAPATARR